MPAIYIFSFQLVSPDDLVNACKMFEPLKLPLRYVHPSLALQPDSHFVATPTIGVSASFLGCLPLCFLEPPREAVQRSRMWSRKWSGRQPSNEAKGVHGSPSKPLLTYTYLSVFQHRLCLISSSKFVTHSLQ